MLVGNWIKAQQQAKLDEAAEAGIDPDTVLPHPDDIHVIEGEGYRITGPADETELDLIKARCARRDLFILQHVLEDRLRSAQGANSALLLVQFMNHGLSELFRLSDTRLLLAIMRHERKTKRELLKEAHSAWRAIGRPKPRGWTLPAFPEMRARLEHTLPALLALYEEVATGKVVEQYAIAERIKEIGSRRVSGTSRST